jgi:hypothetical protein
MNPAGPSPSAACGAGLLAEHGHRSALGGGCLFAKKNI